MDVYEKRKLILESDSMSEKEFLDLMQKCNLESKAKNGFQYLDLNKPDITPGYKPRPQSKPMEVYVAKLREAQIMVHGEDGFYTTNDQIVDSVYRLVTKLNKRVFPNKREFVQRKDGKTLVVKVNQGEAVDSLREHYDARYGPSLGELFEADVSEQDSWVEERHRNFD